MKRAFGSLLLIFAAFAGAVGAQTGGRSVMIYNESAPGTSEGETAARAEQSFVRGLQEKYPCVDWLGEQGLADALRRLREREAATGELDQAALAALGAEVGADYLVVIRSYALPNGQVVIAVRVLDRRTTRTVADRIETAAGEADVGAAADRVAERILQDLAGAFRGQCEPRWTGTISYTIKTEIEKNEDRDLTSIEKVNVRHRESYEQRYDVALQPISKGGKAIFFTNGFQFMTMARVGRRFRSLLDELVTETGQETCRQRGANPYRKNYRSTDRKIVDEQGASIDTLPVEIVVLRDAGRFTIKVATPEMPLRKTTTRTGVRDFCVPQPFNESAVSDRQEPSSFFSFEGSVDPQNPDVLAGRQVTGTLAGRQYAFEWNLRFVTPKKKAK